MLRNKLSPSLTVFVAVLSILFITPVSVLAQQQGNLDGAVSAVEQAIVDNMPKASSGIGPTLQQLGGVQGGSTESDASGGAGGESSGGGGGGCFAPHTLVMLFDGTGKPIGDLAIGDKVVGWDMKTNKATVGTVSRVVSVQSETSYTVDGLSVTGTHPFAVEGGEFVEVQDLTVGQVVLGVDGKDTMQFLRETPLGVAKNGGPGGEFIDLTVDGPHTFFVSPSMEDGRDPFGLTKFERERENGSGSSFTTNRAEEDRSSPVGWKLVHNKSQGGGRGS